MGRWGRQAIDQWRDSWTLIAAKELNDVAAALCAEADVKVARAGWRELTVPATFLATVIAPGTRAVAEPVVADLIGRANSELREIADVLAVWFQQPDAPIREEARFDGFGDIAAAAAPLAGGAAVLAALPTAAVTTTTAWFGLVATTAISWPVVVAGSAVGGTAVLTGLHNSARLKGMFQTRLRVKARKQIGEHLLGRAGQHPSVLEQVTSCLGESAARAKGA